MAKSKKKENLFKELSASEDEDVDMKSGSENGEVEGFGHNKEFAAKFEHNRRREILDRAKQKYGDVLDSDASDVSSSSEDDSDAELLNPKIEHKFIEVLTAIRANDPSIKLVKEEDRMFRDKDFDRGVKDSKSKSKGHFLKDQIREETLKKMGQSDIEDSEGSDGEREGMFTKIGVPLAEEEAQLKREFKSKANESDENEDDFFAKKEDQAQFSSSDEDNDN